MAEQSIRRYLNREPAPGVTMYFVDEDGNPMPDEEIKPKEESCAQMERLSSE